MASDKTTFAESEILVNLPYVCSSFASHDVPATSNKLPSISGDEHAEFQVRDHQAKARLAFDCEADPDPKACFSCFDLQVLQHDSLFANCTVPTPSGTEVLDLGPRSSSSLEHIRFKASNGPDHWSTGPGLVHPQLRKALTGPN